VIDFDYRTNGAEKLQVDVRDSDGARWSGAFPTGHGS